MAGTRIISVSLNDVDYANLTRIKELDGLGATSVLRVGIQHVKDKPRLQAEQMNLKAENEKLFKVIQRLQSRVHELEVQP